MNPTSSPGKFAKKIVFILMGCLAVLSSCWKLVAPTEKLSDYNYIVRPPDGWIMFDTIVKGFDMRVLLGPTSLENQNLFGKIMIAGMENKGIDDYVESKINSLKSHNEGFALLGKGKINIDSIDSRWFSYIWEEDGKIRDMIGYFIPLRDSSCQMVFGTDRGNMDKYRPMFDKIVRSFTTFPLKKGPDTISRYQPGAQATWMKTGFYFLAEGGRGVKMRKDHSDEMYTLNYTPFASVKNVSKVRLLRTRLQGVIYPELYLKFDEKGAKDLEEGTNNGLHGQIAVVVANRLLYVVDNGANINTGVMEIGLSDYSEAELEEMLNTVIQKN